jgi:hypothetical protein
MVGTSNLGSWNGHGTYDWSWSIKLIQITIFVHPSTSSTLDILFESNDVPLFATQPWGQPWTPTRFTRSNWHPESMHCMHHQISKDFPAHYHLRPKHQRSTGFPRRGRGHCVQPSAMVYSPKSLGSAQKLEQGTRNITLKRTSLTDYANINYILIIYI